LKELEISKQGDHTNFLRLGVSTYNFLLQMVTAFAEKKRHNEK
jgi:hypothetical protein